MSSHTQSMANRAHGIHERISDGATRAVREGAPEWIVSLLIDEAERLKTLAMHVAQIHNADEMTRPRTVWDPPELCPHMERCARKGSELAVEASTKAALVIAAKASARYKIEAARAAMADEVLRRTGGAR